MNLADSFNRAKFVLMLEQIEDADRKSNGVLSEWQRTFVESLREKFDSREDAIDLGVTPWNPTVKQWNELHNIWDGL